MDDIGVINITININIRRWNTETERVFCKDRKRYIELKKDPEGRSMPQVAAFSHRKELVKWNCRSRPRAAERRLRHTDGLMRNTDRRSEWPSVFWVIIVPLAKSNTSPWWKA